MCGIPDFGIHRILRAHACAVFPVRRRKIQKIAAPRSSPPEKFAREFCRRVQGFFRFFVTFAENKFSRKICVTFFNKPDDVARLKEGAAYTVSVNIESREYNGRWYTDIRAWRLQPKQAEVPGAGPMPDMPPIAEEPSYASSPAEVDDLPF